MGKKRQKRRCNACGRLDDSATSGARVSRVITATAAANLRERCRFGSSRARKEA